jgi:hypothetical protein
MNYYKRLTDSMKLALVNCLCLCTGPIWAYRDFPFEEIGFLLLFVISPLLAFLTIIYAVVDLRRERSAMQAILAILASLFVLWFANSHSPLR